MPTKTGMLYTIDRDAFHSFMKNTWIGNLGVSCHITNHDTGFYDIKKINESVQGILGNMSATKKASFALKCIKLIIAKGCTYYGP